MGRVPGCAPPVIGSVDGWPPQIRPWCRPRRSAASSSEGEDRPAWPRPVERDVDAVSLSVEVRPVGVRITEQAIQLEAVGAEQFGKRRRLSGWKAPLATMTAAPVGSSLSADDGICCWRVRGHRDPSLLRRACGRREARGLSLARRCETPARGQSKSAPVRKSAGDPLDPRSERWDGDRTWNRHRGEVPAEPRDSPGLSLDPPAGRGVTGEFRRGGGGGAGRESVAGLPGLSTVVPRSSGWCVEGQVGWARAGSASR